MKINFKKVATVLGSALMLGSTAAFAAAASFTPSSFSDGGIALVVGQNAASSDLKAAIDLTANLAPATATAATTATVTGGDSYTFEKSTDKLNVGESASSIKSSLNDEQMPTLLAQGKYLDVDSEEYDYNQEITVPSLTLSLFSDADYKKDTPTIGFRVASGQPVLNYTLEFDDVVPFNKLETTDLPIMGKQYYVLDVSSNNKTLTLLDSADTLTLSEGETQTVTVNGKSYEVSVAYVSDTKVKLTVNGQTTNSLSESSTQKLTDGAYVGIKSIMYSAKDSGVSKVEFSIGAGKLVVENAAEVQMNDEVITDLYGYVINSSATELGSVKLEWKADGDQFIATNKELVMPGFGAVKYSFSGMTYPKSEVITVENDGRDSIKLSQFPLKDGAADINLIYSNETVFVGLGKDADNKLVTGTASVTFNANTDMYFVSSWSDNKTGESILLRASNFRTVDSTDRVTIQQYKDGAWTNVKEDRRVGEEFSIGNMDLNVTGINRAGRVANISTTNAAKVNFNTLYSKEGLKVALPSVSTNASLQTNTAALVFTEEDEDGQYTGTTTSFNLTLGLNDQSPKRASVTAVNGAEDGYEVDSSDVDQYVVESPLATDIKHDRSGDQDTATITYHGDESYGTLLLTAPQATVTSGTTPSSVGVMTVYDNEISSASGKNLIVVGGSCVNTVAAELLGLGAGASGCQAAFTAKTGIKSGEALIESFARSGKVALLVAGYDAADTTKAITYLSNNNVNATVGSKLKVTSATTATAITA